MIYNKEDAWLRSKIPIKSLDIFKHDEASENSRQIDLSGNGYCTDTVFKIIASKLKKSLYQTREINLQGCVLLTDYGIKWLCHIIQDAEHLCQIYLDGCVKLTDASLIMLDQVTPPLCRIMMRGTSLTHLSKLSSKIVTTGGCALLRDPTDEVMEDKTGCIYIIPQNGVKQSLSHYMKTKAVIVSKGDHYETDLMVEGWNMSVLEMPLQSVLFDLSVCNPVQVIIPVDTTSTIEEMKQHVVDTVTAVVSKEKYSPRYEETKVVETEEDIQHDFVDSYHTFNCTLDDCGILHCCCKDESVGANFLCARRLTKTQSFFDVTVIEAPDSSKGDNKLIVGLLQGTLYEMCIQNGSTSVLSSDQTKKFLTSFTCPLVAGRTIKVSVSGNWMSEYSLGPGSYHFFVDGERVKEDAAGDKPDIYEDVYNLHPFIYVLGEAKIKIENVYLPPKEIVTNWRIENKWITPCFTRGILIDSHGLISTTTLPQGAWGSFIAMEPFSPENNECSIKLDNTGKSGDIYIGVGCQLHRFKDQNMFYHSDALFYDCKTGSVIENKGDVPMMGEKSSCVNSDEIKINVDFKSSQENSCVIKFHKNGQKIAECPKICKTAKGLSVLYLIIAIKSEEAKVKLENYHSQHWRPAIESKITLGESYCLNIYDDGVLESNCGCCSKSPGEPGFFISKVPLNEKLLFFEMKVISLFKPVETDKDATGVFYPCSIGLHARQCVKQTTIGTYTGSVSYVHNGKIYNESSNPLTVTRSFSDGDVIGCGIEGCSHLGKPLEFDENGQLKQPQDLHVFFTKNGTRVCIFHITHKSDALFPVILLSKYSRVRVINFQSETRALLNIDKYRTADKTNQSEEDEKSCWNGCEFVVVGMGNREAESKINALQQNINLGTDMSTSIEDVSKQIKKLEKKHLAKLDAHGQDNYTQLCEVLERLECVSTNQQRLHFISIDMASPQILRGMEKIIANTQDRHLQHNWTKYEISKRISVNTKRVLCKLQSSKVLEATATSFEVKDNMTDNTLQAILKYLHQKGLLLLIDMTSQRYAVDVQFMIEVLPAIFKQKTTVIDSNLVTAIGKSSAVWKPDGLISSLKHISKDKSDLLLNLLQRHFGLIKLPLSRTKLSEEPYIYSTRHLITSPPVSMEDYWTGGKGTRDNAVVLRCTYKFPHVISEVVFSCIVARATKYGCVLILTKSGIITQMGAVQTAVVEVDSKSDKSSICVESTCYIPDKREEPITSLTEATVKDYTWNVLCLYTDIVDDVLKVKGIVPMIKKENYDNRVNVSIGCKHNWSDDHEHPHVRSVCTMCNQCCELGDDCYYSGVIGDYLRKCPCNTCTEGCKDCGICQSCVKEFWDIKSHIRPMPMTSVSSKNLLNVPLNQVSFNEVEYIHLNGGSSTLFLKDNNSDTNIQVFPGDVAVIEEKGTDLRHFCHKLRNQKGVMPGVTVKVRLTDPVGVVTPHTEKKVHKNVLQESRVIYHASTCRELRICHETGLLCYDMTSAGYPVGQFIGPKPFSSTFTKFSLKILGLGTREEIGLGITPKFYPSNSMPGWRRSSFGFHSDDGRIYQSQGTSTLGTGVIGKEGDIMECEVRYEDNTAMLYFRHNGNQVHCQELPSAPPGGYYPCVSIRSFGGVVKLLEKEPWIPDRENQIFEKPRAFDTEPYGNLYISPAHTVNLIHMKNYLLGWLLLHNPSQDKIGYQVSGLQFEVTEDKVGSINPGQTLPLYMKILAENAKSCPKDFSVKWIAMEKAMSYNREDVAEKFNNEDFAGRIYEHRLEVVIKETNNDTKIVQKIRDGVHDVQDMYCLQVFVNGTLEGSYWLKTGSYTFDVPYPEGEFIVKYPKAPSYHYPDKIDRGMLVVLLEPGQKYYTLATVMEVKGEGSYMVSYFDKYSNCVQLSLTGQDETDFGMEMEDWKKDIKDFRSSVTNMKTLLATYVPAPSYLLKEGSRYALVATNPDWKQNALEVFSKCSQVFTRVTVQEQDILNKSRSISQWSSKINLERNFSFLPVKMDTTSIHYPDPVKTFTNILVHTVCFMTRQNTKYKLPVHFVDVAGVPPMNELPLKTTFASKHTAWVYVSMLRNKLAMPSYKNLIDDKDSSYSREEIEHAVIKLVHMYASLCSIFSAQYGGLSQQQELGKEGQEIILSNLTQPDKVINNNGKLPTGPITGDELYYGKMGITVCLDHLISFTENFDDQMLETITFGKYAELIHVFCWENKHVKMLPDDFFHKLKTIQIIYMNNCSFDQPSFPTGASKCSQLEYLCLEKLSTSELPKDLVDVTAMQIVALRKMPVKQISLMWPVSHRLVNLELSSLLMEAIPPEICNVKALQRLNVSNNPISDLPAELENLTNLHSLLVDGIPWVKLAGKSKSMSLEQFKDFYGVNTQHILGNQAEELFKKFAQEKNDVLNEKEIADLNLYLLFEIPRLGTKQYKFLDLFPSAFKKLAGKKLDDDEYGGIPPVIFKLKKLTLLSLKYQGITKVPEEIGKLQNLKDIKLDNCPLLERLPGVLGVLPNISDIGLVGCPFLSTPPEKVVRNGFKSVRAFLKELAGGQVLCPRTKLMFVGLGGAGKTSLLRGLMSANKKRDKNKEPLLTDGIDISDWKVTEKEENKTDPTTVTFHTWDFAGQTVYYHTHQFFLSNRAVYLLLWNMRMGFEHAGLDFWLNSITCHAPDAPILIVGTHLDMVSMPELPERHLRNQYKQIHGFYYVSTVDGTNLEDLEKNIVNAALKQGYMKQVVPKVWMDLEERIKLERSKCDYLEWSTITKFAEENGIYDEKIKLALQFLGDLGTIQYFDSEVLNKRIVIKPQWIVDVMAKLVSVKNTVIVKNKGRLYHKDLSKTWEGYDEDVCKWLLGMTEEFDLTFRAPATVDGVQPDCNIVPCLVPDDAPDEDILENISANRGIRDNQILYRFKYLPAGLFNRAQVRLFQFAKDTKIWKRGSVLHKGNNTILIQQARGTSDVSVIVQGQRPENTLLNVHEVFESLIDETYHGVTYDLFIPCPECVIEEKKRNCCLFEDSLIRSAKSKRNVYFLQCRGDFHEIPLVYLHGALPESTSSDFYIRLQQSINSLQELNSSIAKDVAILYCKQNIPTDSRTEATNPVWIRNDLIKHGISCWYDDIHVGGIQYMRTVINSCKVVVVCVTDEFARDPLCMEAFEYAADMNIPICAVVMTRGSEWEKSTIKFRLGNPKMAMLRNKEKYNAKISTLIDMVKSKIKEKEQTREKHKQCFISYNWKNSRVAAKQGTQTDESSLGQDPREIKDFLENNGISCWLDENEVGQEDQLYKDIAVGILNCKVAVLCVSEEYVKSENCMMEARFVIQLEKPFIVAVVGSGSKWIESETGLILQKVANFETVNFQENCAEGLMTLLKHVKTFISRRVTKKTSGLGGYMKQIEEDQDDIEEDRQELENQSTVKNDSLEFKEEVELIQRKFMRHFTQTAKAKYQNVPRLFVLDFYQSGSKSEETNDNKGESTTMIGKDLKDLDDIDGTEAFRSHRKRKLSRHESKMDILRKSDPVDADDFDWTKEQFCIRTLCEHEGGWHTVKDSLSLKMCTKDEVETYLEKASPYLMYLYIISKFSSIPLLCLNGKKGEEFQNWILEKARSKNTGADSFLEAYDSLTTIVLEHEDQETFLAQLNKCHLPTGKNLWLCGADDSSHQNGERIVKLGIGAGGKSITNLYRDDILLHERLQKTVGEGYLKFATHQINASWKHGSVPIKVLRVDGAGGVLKRIARLELNSQKYGLVKTNNYPITFQHGQTEGLLKVYINHKEVTEDTTLHLRSDDDMRIHVKYDGGVGVYHIPSDTFTFSLSSGYTLKIPVKRAKSMENEVIVGWRTKHQSTSDGDFTPTKGTIKFLENDAEQTINIEVNKQHRIGYKKSVSFEVEIYDAHWFYTEISESNSAIITVYNDIDHPGESKEGTATRQDGHTTTRKNIPTFKAVANTAMISNAAMAATKNKSKACSLQ